MLILKRLSSTRVVVDIKEYGLYTLSIQSEYLTQTIFFKIKIELGKRELTSVEPRKGMLE